MPRVQLWTKKDSKKDQKDLAHGNHQPEEQDWIADAKMKETKEIGPWRGTKRPKAPESEMRVEASIRAGVDCASHLMRALRRLETGIVQFDKELR